MKNRVSDLCRGNSGLSGLGDERFTVLTDAIDRLPVRENGDTVIVAIDGRSASGKTTLSEYLETEYDCNVFHMDDFFLRPEQRTEERLYTPGENTDHERVLGEILLPLKRNSRVLLRRYNCHTQCLEKPVRIPHKRLNIVEGVYALHPALRDCYDLTVFYDILPDEQRERIRNRNRPEIAEKYFSVWIPLEERYFLEMSIRNKADILL